MTILNLNIKDYVKKGKVICKEHGVFAITAFAHRRIKKACSKCLEFDETFKSKCKQHVEDAKAKSIKSKNSLHFAIKKFGENSFSIKK